MLAEDTRLGPFLAAAGSPIAIAHGKPEVLTLAERAAIDGVDLPVGTVLSFWEGGTLAFEAKRSPRRAATLATSGTLAFEAKLGERTEVRSRRFHAGTTIHFSEQGEVERASSEDDARSWGWDGARWTRAD